MRTGQTHIRCKFQKIFDGFQLPRPKHFHFDQYKISGSGKILIDYILRGGKNDLKSAFLSYLFRGYTISLTFANLHTTDHRRQRPIITEILF